MVLRNHGGSSHRGPLPILVVWIALALLSCIWLRTSISLNKWETAAASVVLHAIYFLSLLLKGTATYVQRRTLANDVSFFFNSKLCWNVFDDFLFGFLGTSKSVRYKLRSFS